MDKKIDNLRKKITQIDEQLLGLLSQRLNFASQIGILKRLHEMPIEDPQYEGEKRRKREEKLAKLPAHRETIEMIFGAIIKGARQVQRKTAFGDETTKEKKTNSSVLRVAVMGSMGSFSEEAALHYLKAAGTKKFQLLYPVSADGVLSALDEKTADIGIFPIHNSIGGLVIESIYAASEHDFSIEELFEIDIRQCLMALPGVKKTDIKKITSHPQALAQCKGYLKATFPKAQLIEANDTATAAQMLSNHPAYKTTAVIAPKRCAAMYGIQLLEGNIQDQKINHTQFIVARA